MIEQKSITLPAYKRGCHLITNDVVYHLPKLPDAGLLHLFIQHTSAALSINENADASVQDDLSASLDHLVKENESFYTHTYEGSDDMPAHIKSTVVGASVTIPITKGELNLGTWQGIYLCEFRNNAGRRRLIATVYH